MDEDDDNYDLNDVIHAWDTATHANEDKEHRFRSAVNK